MTAPDWLLVLAGVIGLVLGVISHRRAYRRGVQDGRRQGPGYVLPRPPVDDPRPVPLDVDTLRRSFPDVQFDNRGSPLIHGDGQSSRPEPDPLPPRPMGSPAPPREASR